MGRKKKCRTIDIDMKSICSSFWPLHDTQESRGDAACIVLEADELQVLQLKDGEGLTMIEWAKRMGISKSVFGDMHKKARAKLVDMVLHAKTLVVKCPYKDANRSFIFKR